MRRFFRAGGARIARGILGYVVGMAVLATLSPFDFQHVPEQHFGARLFPGDILLNCLLLLPAGFILSLTERNCRLIHALGFGLVLSTALEGAQLFLPSRDPNIVDIFTNAIGCGMGALAERRMRRVLGTVLSERLLLELPLTGALYVMAPLLALLGLGSGGSERGFLVMPLLCFGAIILRALYRERVAREHQLSKRRFALISAFGLTVLTAPAFASYPIALVAVFGLAFVLVATAPEVRPDTQSRRFEARTVRRGLPFVLLYVLGATLSPFYAPDLALGTEGGQHEAFRLLEWVAALTLIGYLASELTARSQVRPSVLYAGIATLGALIAMVMLAGAERERAHLSPLALAPLMAAAVAGAALHRAQVQLVRDLRATWSSAPPGLRTAQDL